MPGGHHIIYPNAIPGKRPSGRCPDLMPEIVEVVSVEAIFSKGRRKKRIARVAAATRRDQVYVVKFKVRGKFEFPLDMLRYDGCHPDSQEDVEKIARKLGVWRQAPENLCEKLEICLVKTCSEKRWRPTEGRWSSFGWTVVPDSIKEERRP